MAKSYKKLRLILGDQLNTNHSWFDTVSDDTLYLLMEMRQETDYTVHHIQKIIAFFLGMRNFSEELKQAGHHVLYYQLNDPDNTQALNENISNIIQKYAIQKFEYQLPDEYRLDQQLISLSASLPINSEAFDTEHFLTSRSDLEDFFASKKSYLMESFYRNMRKKYGILMTGDEPVTGKWNYDASNRKKLPKSHTPSPPIRFTKDVTALVSMIENSGVKTMGTISKTGFTWPVTRAEGLKTLEYFVEELLPFFGQFQDAMTTKSWSVYHSRLSFCMNAKLLSPMEVVKAVEKKWNKNPKHASINQVEGFIRQIIGWREYMRGVYWAKMPEYSSLNHLGHTRPLPEWYWTGNTKMNCLKHAIGQSLEHAYAHHIQRLMITGNFALLAGCHPDEVDQWYLGIYIDALEWVEITNTRGMSQFADGGIVGTKPYVSSANYIDKMSDYCGSCFYSKKEKIGPKACPFNSLYWHFYDRHRKTFSKNPRIGLMYRVLDKMEPNLRTKTLLQAEEYLKNLDEL